MEFAMNFCSHACTFCFANLNKPKRWHNVKETMRTLAVFESGQRKSPIDAMLRLRYPILISNRVDPFAESNYRQTLPIVKILHQKGVPVSFQTRGGKGIDDVLSYLPKSVWYLTFNCWNDKLRKRLEPGAPSIDSRKELLQELHRRGHALTIGMNPFVPAWWTDSELEEAFEFWKATGVYGVWALPYILITNKFKI